MVKENHLFLINTLDRNIDIVGGDITSADKIFIYVKQDPIEGQVLGYSNEKFVWNL